MVRAGGVVAYPTEGVFGLGCMPDDADAVIRVLTIKQRSPAAGLILIASDIAQLAGWIELPDKFTTLASSLSNPVTWVVPAAAGVPYWILGRHVKLAVRITRHPVAAALCEAVDSPLVSTSANVAGHPPACNVFVVRRTLGHLVDCIVPGSCGPSRGPSEIRDLETGKILRAAST